MDRPTSTATAGAPKTTDVPRLDLARDGRILYMSWVDLSVGDGPGVNELEFVLALHRLLGDRAHFLVPRPEQPIVGLPSSCTTFSRPHRKHSAMHLPRHVISQSRLAGELLADGRFDLLVMRLDVLPLGSLYVTRRHRVPYVLKTLGQGNLNALAGRWGPVGGALARLNTALVGRLARHAVVADSVSELQVRLLTDTLDLPPDQVVFVDNAVNTDRFFPMPTTDAREQLGLAQFDQLLGYVGTRPWERGGMQLVEVLPRLLGRYPGLGVVALGDGAGLESLRARAAELGVDDRCVFTGYVPYSLVPVYVNALDVGVSISLRPDRAAASELKVRQYLAAGKPVVLSPGSNEFVEHEAFGSVVDARDLDAVEAACNRWLALDPDERGAFAARAAGYMREGMSVEAAVRRRLELWSERLTNS